MEILNDILPLEVINRIQLYMIHPIVEIIERDRMNLLAYEGHGQTWEEFAHIKLYRYKSRCKKKPKHGKLMAGHIQSFEWYLEYFRDVGKKPEHTSFYKFCLRNETN